MPYIKQSFIKQQLGGHSDELWFLSLVFNDGYMVTSNMPANFKPANISAPGLAVIPELEGLNLDEDLLKTAEEIVITQASALRSFPLLLSAAILKALAHYQKKPLYVLLQEIAGNNDPKLPTPIITYFYGAASGETDLDFSEYLLLPGAKNARSVKEKILTMAGLNGKISELLSKNGYEASWGRSGAWSASLNSSIAAFNLLEAAVIDGGWTLGADYQLGVAVGAGQLYNKKTGKYHFGGDQLLSGVDLLSVFSDWHHQHHIGYLEDACDGADQHGADNLYAELGGKMLLSANRTLAGDEAWLRNSLSKRYFNCVSIELSDFAKWSQLLEFVQVARKHNLAIVLVDQSANNQDVWLSDLAVALNFDFVRFGSLFGLERTQKYNRLCTIEEELAS